MQLYDALFFALVNAPALPELESARILGIDVSISGQNFEDREAYCWNRKGDELDAEYGQQTCVPRPVCGDRRGSHRATGAAPEFL